tara:strand:- start:16110 stop:17735 length:1626 start_codon:yes stop_codon:yes gene_type:complete
MSVNNYGYDNCLKYDNDKYFEYNYDNYFKKVITTKKNNNNKRYSKNNKKNNLKYQRSIRKKKRDRKLRELRRCKNNKNTPQDYYDIPIVKSIDNYNNNLFSLEILHKIFKYCSTKELIEIIPYVCLNWRKACSLINIDELRFRNITINDYYYELTHYKDVKKDYKGLFKTINNINIAKGQILEITSIYNNINSLDSCALMFLDLSPYNYQRRVSSFFKNINRLQEFHFNFSTFDDFNKSHSSDKYKPFKLCSNALFQTCLECLSYYNFKFKKLYISDTYYRKSDLHLDNIYQKCQYLEYINIKYSLLTSINDVSINCPSLKEIVLIETEFNDTIMHFINRLANLNKLYIWGCNYISKYKFNSSIPFNKLKILHMIELDIYCRISQNNIIKSDIATEIIINSPILEEVNVEYNMIDFEKLFEKASSILNNIVIFRLSLSFSNQNETDLLIISKLFDMFSQKEKISSFVINLYSKDQNLELAIRNYFEKVNFEFVEYIQNNFEKVNFECKLQINGQSTIDKNSTYDDIIYALYNYNSDSDYDY